MLSGCGNLVCLQLNTYIIFYRSWIKSNCYKRALFVTSCDLASALQAFLGILFVLRLPFINVLTLLASNTQWLFPSSSIWFHQRKPTRSLPVTF